jgi:hypothetical protein
MTLKQKKTQQKWANNIFLNFSTRITRVEHLCLTLKCKIGLKRKTKGNGLAYLATMVTRRKIKFMTVKPEKQQKLNVLTISMSLTRVEHLCLILQYKISLKRKTKVNGLAYLATMVTMRKIKFYDSETCGLYYKTIMIVNDDCK